MLFREVSVLGWSSPRTRCRSASTCSYNRMASRRLCGGDLGTVQSSGRESSSMSARTVWIGERAAPRLESLAHKLDSDERGLGLGQLANPDFNLAHRSEGREFVLTHE